VAGVCSTGSAGTDGADGADAAVCPVLTGTGEMLSQVARSVGQSVPEATIDPIPFAAGQ